MVEPFEKLTLNELRVLWLIFQHSTLGRIQISSRLKVTRAAVTLIVKKLVSLQLIRETGQKQPKTGRGRRQILLEMHPNAGCVVTVHFALHYYSIALVNLAGSILSKTTHQIDHYDQPRKTLELTAKSIQAMMKETSSAPVLGVSVALPGIVDEKRGMAVERTLVGWHDYSVQEHLQALIGLPVFVANDVKLDTIGEFYFGAGQGVRDLVCLWLEDGVGVGVVINGRLIRGVTSSAGEIGFNPFFTPIHSTEILYDDKARYWGDVLSFTNFENSIRRGLKADWESSLTADSDVFDLLTAINHQDSLAVHLYSLICDVLSVVASQVIYAYNPRMLIFSGPFFKHTPKLIERLQDQFSNAGLQTPLGAVELKISSLGEDSISLGGAALLMDRFFSTYISP